MRRGVSAGVALLLLVCLAACGYHTGTPQPTTATSMTSSPLVTSATPMHTSKPTTTPTPEPTIEPASTSPEAEETDEPEPMSTYDIPDMEKVGLTDEQFEKIDVLLYGLSGIYEASFNNAKKLMKEDYLRFTERIMEAGDILGKSGENDSYLTINEIKAIVKSGLNVNYHAKNGDSDGWDNSIVNSKLELIPNGGDPREYPHIYSISKISSDKILLKYNIIVAGNADQEYRGKAQVVLKYDESSIFGYHVESLESCSDKLPVFQNAQASSYLPDNRMRSFSPDNAFDMNDKTAWITENGIGEWIMVSSATKQNVSAISFFCGDWFDESTFDQSGQPCQIKIEFSDGTIMDVMCVSNFLDAESCITFGREISTTYIKITIITIDEYYPQKNIAVTEIKPY